MKILDFLSKYTEVMFFIAIGALICLGLFYRPETAVVQETMSISKPKYVQYESCALNFKSDTLSQKVDIKNSKQNDSILVVTMTLSDGTELWKSEELEPGEKITDIEINKKLKKDTHPKVTVNYQFYTNDLKKNRSASMNLKTRINVD